MVMIIGLMKMYSHQLLIIKVNCYVKKPISFFRDGNPSVRCHAQQRLLKLRLFSVFQEYGQFVEKIRVEKKKTP